MNIGSFVKIYILYLFIDIYNIECFKNYDVFIEFLLF